MYITLKQCSVVFLINGVSVSQAQERFRHWYSIYNHTLHDFAGEDCYPNYKNKSWPQYSQYNDSSRLPIDNCKNMASCLLKNLDDFDKADMQAASVLLGLTPTALSYIGPNVGELALLFTRRPVLAGLMAIGAPVISVTRLFDVTSFGEPLNRKEWPFHSHQKSTRKATGISITQYLLTAGAVAMCIVNSLRLGEMTVLSWKCLFPYMHICWNMMSVGPLACAAASLWCTKVSDCKPSMRIQGLKKTVYRPF